VLRVEAEASRITRHEAAHVHRSRQTVEALVLDEREVGRIHLRYLGDLVELDPLPQPRAPQACSRPFSFDLFELVERVERGKDGRSGPRHRLVAGGGVRARAGRHGRLGRLHRQLEVVGAARLGIDEDPVGDLDPLAQELDVAHFEHGITGQRVLAVGVAGEPVGALDVLEIGSARNVEGLVVVLLGERLHAGAPSTAAASIRGAISLRAIRARYTAASDRGSESTRGRRARTEARAAASWFTYPRYSASIAKYFPAHAAHREAEPDVLGSAYVVHDDPRPERAHHLDEAKRLLRVDRLHLAQEIERRADAALVALVHREPDHLAHVRRQHRELEAAVERGAHERVGVLHRGGLWRDHDDAIVADHEVVHHRGVGAGAEVDEHEVGVERAQRPHEAHPQRVRGLRAREIRARRGDQAQVRERSVLEQLAHVFFALGGVLGHAALRARDAERSVEIGALEIAVDGDDAVPGLRERRGEIRRHERLADAPLAAAERNQARRTVLRSFARSADHLSPSRRTLRRFDAHLASRVAPRRRDPIHRPTLLRQPPARAPRCAETAAIPRIGSSRRCA
jgi:hypothetical protein